jgi:hypothetical protein
MKTYLGANFQVGRKFLTIFRAPYVDSYLFLRVIGTDVTNYTLTPITYLYCGFAFQVIESLNYSNVAIVTTITDDTLGSEMMEGYIIANFYDFTTDAQITDEGILTGTLLDTTVLTTSGAIIYPIPVDPEINSVASVIYTYANLQQYLIIRSGLTAPTSDTFVSATTFVTDDDFNMGGGTIRFSIQNISGFDLTLTPGVDWSFQTGNNDVIPAGYCGTFFVSVTIDPPSCLIYSIGTFPLDG